MTIGSVLTPWLALAAVLVPLVYLERWIHSHLYGVGWLVSRGNTRTATVLYYVILFPGVFVHEFTQYLVAGALNVRIKKVVAWPEAQNDGTLRLDFVRIQKARWYQAAIIGAAPLLVGTALVWLISNHVLKLTELLDAIGTGDITVMGTAAQHLASAPDFYIWLYLIFAISNAMFPTPADRQGWPLLAGGFTGLIVLLLILGVKPDVLLSWYKDHIAVGLEIMTTAFAAVFVVAFANVMLIGFLEEVLEQVTRRKFDYGRSRPKAGAPPRSQYRGREPGSAAPLPFDVPLPSIYNQELPVPNPARQALLPPRKSAAKAMTRAAAADSAASPRQPAPQREPARPTAAVLAEPGRAASGLREPRPPAVSPDRPVPESQSIRREIPPSGPSREGLAPADGMPLQRPGRPYDPAVTVAGNPQTTQRLTPAVRAPQVPGRPGTTDARLPEQRLSVPDDEDEDLTGEEDNEEIEDSLDEDEDGDIQLVDFDDI